MSARRTFHIAPASTWPTQAGGELAPPSLASEGFVHLSYADQLAGTLLAHFGDAPPQCLLEVAPERIADALRVEPSRGGDLFPHLYRALRSEDVLRWWPLSRAENGSWSLPRLGATSDADSPQGTARG